MNNSDNSKPDWLQSLDSSFKPPVSEHNLKKRSKKAVFSTRQYPNYVVAAIGILRTKYPALVPRSASELLEIIVQDYVSAHYDKIDYSLPGTLESIDYLLRAGFINPEAKQQLDNIAGAQKLASTFEAEAAGEDNLARQYEYYLRRDPDKAQEILDKMTAQMVEGLDKEPEQEPSVSERFGVESTGEETVVPHHSYPQSQLPDEDKEQLNKKPVKDSSGIATPDWLLELEEKQKEKNEAK